MAKGMQSMSIPDARNMTNERRNRFTSRELRQSMPRAQAPISTKQVLKAGQGLHVNCVCVTTVEPNGHRQLDGLRQLKKTSNDMAFGEEIRGPDLELRPPAVPKGDSLACYSMDRLSRNLDDLRKLLLKLTG